jgi:chromosome segregation ATPase
MSNDEADDAAEVEETGEAPASDDVGEPDGAADPESEAPEGGADEEGGIQALKVASTRVEEVAIGGPVAEGDDATFEEMQGLQAASTRTEGVQTDDTPLIVLEDTDSLDTESDELSVPALVGEVKRLRSHNQILRTERTSIAGRKYALEVVIESLREKMDQAVDALDELEEAGPDADAETVSATIQGMRLILEDARRIADTKAVLERDLAEERRRHLEERQEFEQKAYEAQETIQGLRHERDALRETVTKGEASKIEWMERLAEVQERLEDEEISRGQVEAEAATQLETYAEQAREAESREAAARASADEAQGRIKELESELEAARAEAAEAKTAIESERESARAESSLGETLRVEVKALEDEREALRSELEAKLGVVDMLREKKKSAAGERDAAIAERDALTAERDTLSAELEAASGERDAQTTERYALEAERDELKAQLEAAQQERSAVAESSAAGEARLADLGAQLERAEQRVVEVEAKAKADSEVFGPLQVQVEELEAKLAEATKTHDEQRSALRDVKPLVEDWSRLDKECQRLSRLVGEARSRGRVDVNELIARAALLRRLDKLTK